MRYHHTYLRRPEVKGAMVMSGPSFEEGVPAAVRGLLDRPGALQVATLYKNVDTGEEYAHVYTKVED